MTSTKYKTNKHILYIKRGNLETNFQFPFEEIARYITMTPIKRNPKRSDLRQRGIQQAFHFLRHPNPAGPLPSLAFPPCTLDKAPGRGLRASDLITCVHSSPHNNGPSAGSCKYVAVRYKLPVPHLHPLPDLYVTSFDDKSRCYEGVGWGGVGLGGAGWGGLGVRSIPGGFSFPPRQGSCDVCLFVFCLFHCLTSS